MYSENVCGKMDFTPEEIEGGKLCEFVKYLISMHCEIRLWTDDYCYIVEYIQRHRKEDGYEFILNEPVECHNEDEDYWDTYSGISDISDSTDTEKDNSELASTESIREATKEEIETFKKTFFGDKK